MKKKPQIIEDKELKKAIAREFEIEGGKSVVVALPSGNSIRIEYHCMDKDTDTCSECGLRFNCYSCQYLTIPYKDLYPYGDDLKETISERAEFYINTNKKSEIKSK